MSFFAAAAASAFAFVSVSGFSAGTVVLGALCFLVAGGGAIGSAAFAFFCFLSAMRAARLDTFPETVCSVGGGDGLDEVPFFVSILFELTLVIRRRRLLPTVDVTRGVAASAAVTPIRKSTRLADIAMRTQNWTKRVHASIASQMATDCTLLRKYIRV